MTTALVLSAKIDREERTYGTGLIKLYSDGKGSWAHMSREVDCIIDGMRWDVGCGVGLFFLRYSRVEWGTPDMVLRVLDWLGGKWVVRGLDT